MLGISFATMLLDGEFAEAISMHVAAGFAAVVLFGVIMHYLSAGSIHNLIRASARMFLEFPMSTINWKFTSVGALIVEEIEQWLQ